VKKGDFVKHAWSRPREKMLGVILEKVRDPPARNLFGAADVDGVNVYKVLWRDGTIVTAYGYGLVKVHYL